VVALSCHRPVGWWRSDGVIAGAAQNSSRAWFD